MPLVFEVCFTLTFREFLWVSWYAGYRRIALWLLPAALSLLCGIPGMVLTVCMGYIEPGASPVLALAFPVGMFVVLFVLLPGWALLSLWRLWRQVPELGSPRTYRFSELGIEEEMSTAYTRFAWSHVRSAWSAGDLILLKVGPRLYHVIPERAFNDPKHLEYFKELLGEMVADTRWLR